MSGQETIPLIRPYQADTAFIQRAGETVTRAEFLAAASGLARQLPDRPFAVNLCRDRYYFMLGFCAALINGTTTLLPPGRQAQTVAEMAAAYNGSYCLTDDDDSAGLPVVNIASLPPSPMDRPVPAVPLIPGDQLAAIAFTSGSTGKPKPNEKRWFSLAGAAQMLAQRFFGSGGRPGIVATVPSQHMYGLEMTVMMALQGGALLHHGHPFYPTDVAATLASIQSPLASVLVTTPVHLRAILGAGPAAAPTGKIISATAPLAPELAQRAEQLLGAPVEEVYGCTEAGSMATRRTCKQDYWTLLAGMEMFETERGFRISGPQLAASTPLQDRLEKIDARTFRLLGRSADLLNVGGKRASLADLTQRLLDIEGVEDAVVVVPDASDRPAALVVSALAQREILNALAQVVDPVFLPRPLKKVAALPRNETGKVTRALALAALANQNL